MTISLEPNQSLISPRSSKICSAPIARLRVPKPNQSNFCGSTPRALRQKHHHAKKADDSQRSVDIEHITPSVIFSEPAAEHGAEHGTDHNANAE